MVKVKTRAEKDHGNFFLKAEQFLNAARDSYKKKNWNAVGLTTVHAVISANDALCVYLGQVRSASENHSDAITLLLKLTGRSEESEKSSKHFGWLINRKNLIEYESRLFYQKEAEEALVHAERFFGWVKGKIADE